MFAMKSTKSDMCCVGIHSYHGALIVGCFVLICTVVLISIDSFNINREKIKVGDLLSYVYFALRQKAFYRVEMDVVLNSIWCLSSITLIVANIRLHLRSYLPFIYCSYLIIFFSVVKIVLFTRTAFAVYNGEVREIKETARTATSIQIGLLEFLSAIMVLLAYEAICVVKSARRFVIKHRGRVDSMRLAINSGCKHLDGYASPV
ncbi:hypothetical protein M3Y98_01171900 [Aphelenchoides besseyi]|nr:hypothetical protein M3Y98_01171900 [Aphelenchoides besseyi]KAI6210976.1 hypothetical protein M3Y96_00384600 [Aphelenchoides besseyi]